MIDHLIDYLAGATFGPWTARTIISLCLLIIVVAVGWWIVLSRSNGWITTSCLALIWLATVAVFFFFLPMLVQ